MLMSLDFELSRIRGSRAAGIALDWSKCYDRISLSVLRRAAELAGIPQQMAALMISIYESPRHIRIDTAVGMRMAPVRGLVPGCPAATDWMTLLTWPWLCKVRSLNDRIKGRAWVDDLTAWMEGPTEELCDFIDQTLVITTSMQDNLGLQLNLIKSGILVSHADLKATMLERPHGINVEVKDCIKDLGVAQGRAREATQLGRQRWQSATSRLGRTARLALPFGNRVKIAATSALIAATYGSAARPSPAGLLSSMRRWMMHAVWRGTTRVCAELLLHTGDIPWRGDPWALTLWKLCDFFGALVRTAVLTSSLWLSSGK